MAQRVGARGGRRAARAGRGRAHLAAGHAGCGADPGRKLPPGAPLARSGIGPFLESSSGTPASGAGTTSRRRPALALSPALDARLRAAIACARAALEAATRGARHHAPPHRALAALRRVRARTRPSSTSRPTAMRSPRSGSSTRAARASSSPAATSSASPTRRAAGSSSSPSTASPSTCRCCGARSRGWRPPRAHVDLRHLWARLGHAAG